MPRAATFRSFARPPWSALFAVAGGGLILSAYGAATAIVPALCASGVGGPWISGNGVDALRFDGLSFDALGLAIALNSSGQVLGGWALMLLAMMPPLLAAPLMHVWRSSLPRRRGWAVAQFVIGYGATWMAVGPLLIAIAVTLLLLSGGSRWVVGWTVLAALLWSASPWQRAALNRGHRLARISLFGWAAARDCVRFGVVHGGWCVASCWPWMLAAMVAEDWHLPFMVAAGAIMLGERLAQPNQPRWHWPVLLTALDPRTNLAPLLGMLRHG